MCNSNSLQNSIEKNINMEKISYSYIFKNIIYKVFLNK